jgi:CO/xanthine dehydrogenase FAD-binding subunit
LPAIHHSGQSQENPDLDYIKEEGGMLKIGALTRLEDIAESEIVKTKYACWLKLRQNRFAAYPRIRPLSAGISAR